MAVIGGDRAMSYRRPGTGLLVDMEGEHERAVVDGVEIHRAARMPVLAGAAGDGERGVGRVEERALDHYLAAGQHGRPHALERDADLRPHAAALIVADLRR